MPPLEDELTILVSSAGRRVGLIDCFRQSAHDLGLKLTVGATDMNPALSAACQVADFAEPVPPVSDECFLPVMLDLCSGHEIDLVVPTIDTELQKLAAWRTRFDAIGTRALVSPQNVIDTVRDKLATMRVLKAAGVPVPSSASLADVRNKPDAFDWPLFVKPTGGSSSRGLATLTSPADLPGHDPEPMMAQSLLTGPEFTVNVFVDRAGTMRTAVAHERLQVRAGEVEKGRTVRRDDLTAIAGNICRALSGLTGVFCFQVIDDPRLGPCVIEINARFGGGYPLAHHAGAPFARWLLEEASGRACNAHDEWREGVTMLRHDREVFLDA